MTKKLWFRAKTYGWGWTPCSWEGWLVLFISIGLIIFGVKNQDPTQVVFAVAALLLICYEKGETPRWRWGKNS